MEIKFNFEYNYTPIEDTRHENGDVITYKAIDCRYGRTVFIKEVAITGNDTKEIYTSRDFAEREITAMAKLENDTPFTPRIYTHHFDRQSNKLYIIMQEIKGRSLRFYIDNGVAGKKMLNWMVNLCDILTVFEHHHLQHRDIKPENIIIVADKYLYLIDFDITIRLPQKELGSPFYRAPELEKSLIENGYIETDMTKIDMFAVGVMLYEYYTGQRPQLNKKEDYQLNLNIFIPKPCNDWDSFVTPRDKNPAVAEKVNEIIVRCMKLRPQNRYGNAAELKRALIDALKSLPKKR